MRNPTSVEITQAVLHLVGDDPNRSVILSNRPQNFGESPEAKSFVAKHILQALRAEKAITAKFGNRDGAVAKACKGIFDHPEKFLRHSDLPPRIIPT